ncbi:MAG: hypothetical protein KDI19_09815 [Pseudomonadales bacterium]|nr:hypothetical protein [Pseudomonadales bacterium]
MTQDCEHDWLVRGRTLALTFTIDDWQGPVEFISRCTGCGRFALLRLLYWTGVRLDTRVFAVSLLGNEAAGTFLHDMETGYCDLQRHAAELMALVSSAGPIERVVTTSPGPVVRSSCPTAYAPSLASRPWREIEPGREDERWHKLLEDA